MRVLASLPCLAALAVLTALVPACASPEDEGIGAAEGAATANESGTRLTTATTSFTGTFIVRDASYVKHTLEFKIGNIDWRKGTAHWQHVKDGTETRDLDMTISAARCPGCYTLIAQSSGKTIASVGIGAWELSGITYFGAQAEKLTLKDVSDAPIASGDPKDRGACSRVCDGRVVGCFEKTRETCNWGAFDPAPVCLHSFEFKAGGACP